MREATRRSSIAITRQIHFQARALERVEDREVVNIKSEIRLAIYEVNITLARAGRVVKLMKRTQSVNSIEPLTFDRDQTAR